MINRTWPETILFWPYAVGRENGRKTGLAQPTI
jgi:hypothetical protein